MMAQHTGCLQLHLAGVRRPGLRGAPQPGPPPATHPTYQGTDPQRLAECLGLDPSRFSGGSGSGGAGAGGMKWLREEALQVGPDFLPGPCTVWSACLMMFGPPNRLGA